MSESSEKSWLANAASQPAFYLVYLVFYFAPWLFRTPALNDVAVGLLAVAVFIPIHFYAFSPTVRYRGGAIAIVMALSAVTAPFFGGHGVYVIYAGAMSGYIRRIRVSGIFMAVNLAVYLLAAHFAGRIWFELAFVAVMALIVYASTLSDASRQRRQVELERARELDKQQASLMERERIARDLHDLLGHTLTMVALKTEVVSRLMDVDVDRAKAELLDIQQSTRNALKDVRTAVSGLTVISVQHELDNAAKALDVAGVKLNVTGQPHVLSQEQEKVAGLMIREAVTNIVRHSGATEALIAFAAEDGQHALTVTDNGGGSVTKEGSGLGGLRLRIEKLGGVVTLSSGEGVLIKALLPVVEQGRLS